MVQINFAQKTVNVKIVYYGPGMSGKTTNLEVIHQRAPDQNRGDLTSISTDGDRTLFFDYMPLELGTVAGMRTSFQLYTVPGQVYYNSTRKLVLQGVDGVIFVADSSASMLDQNLESIRNLEENLNEYGKSLADLPHVIQWNKRDLPDAMSTDELDRHLNHHGAPTFEATANSGQGVFPTLKALAANVLRGIMQEKRGMGAPSVPAAAPAAQHGAAPAAPAASAAPQPTAPPPQVAPAPAPQPAMQAAPQPAAQATAPVPHQAPAAQASPGSLMNHQGAAAPAPRPHTRPKAQGAAVRRARSRPQPVEAAPKRKGMPTGVFVSIAAVGGAALAWAAMHFLG